MTIRSCQKILAYLSVSLLLAACSTSAVNTPETIAKTIAQAIINSDKTSFEKYIINQDVAIQMFQQLIVSAKKDELYKQRLPKLEKELTTLKTNSNATLARVRSRVIASFETINKHAKRDGVDLSKGTFGKVIDIRSNKYLDRIKYDIYFTINTDGTAYTIKLNNVVTVSDKLYLLNAMIWKGKNEKLITKSK
ncbi:hypothetical protein MNBD_GAMMA12-669 [hydrothermal vent metagenome]|uniref:Lipoprotein n=1 Tax=hydrothermal vent metagenome TaxID=652676 RepID=A0A3B0YKS5_9ZZZZ